jgi:undecaprenyl-diphosphatase
MSATRDLFERLDARDRQLFSRWAVFDNAPRAVRAFWMAVTHLGGATVTIAACLVPIILRGPLANVGSRAIMILVVSHFAVQLVKRTVGRSRPSRAVGYAALIREPDRFSFPSGHAAASMSVAAAYAHAFPQLAPAIVALAVVIGLSRVVLGVHFPGDVLSGQLIAILTAVPFILV